MRTIKENFLYRLEAQAEEAELRGMVDVAEALTHQITKHAEATRPDGEFYSYAAEDFKNDVESELWSAMIRIADFYGIVDFDASQLHSVLQKTADNLVIELCAQAGINHGVGAYEPTVPGEMKQHVAIEIEE